MLALVPPQPPLRWTHTPEEIHKLAKEVIEEYRAAEDRIGALAPEESNFESLALALAEAKRIATIEPLKFYQNVSPSKELRDAANAAEVAVTDFLVDSSMRIDVFRAKQAARKNIHESGRPLTQEERRLMDKMILDGTRSCLALAETERAELQNLNKELSQACIEFCKNCNEEKGHVSFTLEELKGVPVDVISGYSKRNIEGGEELYDVTFQFPDMFPLLKYAENPDTRRIAFERFESRLTINEPILDKILKLRRQVAQLLGYATWADYVTEVNMVKSGKGVEEFLSDLQKKLKPVGLKEREALLALKRREHVAKGFAFDGEFYVWDHRYYQRMHAEESFSLDQQLVKEHLPVSVVVPAILDIYQNLLGVTFVQMEGETWHSDVMQYAVWEKDAKNEKDFLGYCYFDIYPHSKFSGAAMWPILPGYDQEDGTRSYPVAAMVANLVKPTPEHPALIEHGDLVMFFHEMGHVFHELLSKTRFARFHGTTVALDFGEAPSQMLENWCYEPKVLERMSSHYETGEPLSKELIDSIVKSRFVNVGLSYLKQVHWSIFDLRVHTEQEIADYDKLWNELRESVALVKAGNLGGGPGALSHIAGGYDVGLYGYMYSLVFAADMYTTVFKADPLDPERGRRYREKVLRPGSSKDELDLLKDFLGREPNAEAFVQQIFGTSS
ncbi:metallopeptidase MepB [Trametes polyzona]|nr:metallopeptidase MepB [Trametes polyzona]